MKRIISFLVSVSILFLAVSMSMGASYVLPYPWSKVNILFAVLFLILAYRPSGSVVWMSFLAHFFLELYAVTPFGVLLLSGTLSMLFTYWAYQYLFSNRSWYAMVAMSVFTLCLYRVIYAISLWVFHLVDMETQVAWSSIAETAAWEIVFTSSLIALLYLLFFYQKRKPLITSMYGR